MHLTWYKFKLSNWVNNILHVDGDMSFWSVILGLLYRGQTKTNKSDLEIIRR